MSEIRKWLESIGLGQYGDAYEANHIDLDLLQHVDDHAEGYRYPERWSSTAHFAVPLPRWAQLLSPR